VAFTQPEDAETHSLLAAINLNTSLSRVPDSALLPANALITDYLAVQARFEIFDDALKRTEQFADSILSRTDFGTPIMPGFPGEHPAIHVLRRKAFEGALQRYSSITPAVTMRLEHELDLIGRKGFAPYFLIVNDIVRQSPRTCGRGSGAASLVCYCLGITNVDPIRYNLMFERFLNPGRKDPPDIDSDFAWDERDNVLKYVFAKYGNEHTAMVAVHSSFGARMALREVGRVYGFTEAEISAITKKFPGYYEQSGDGSCDIGAIFQTHPQASGTPLDPPWPEIIKRAKKLFGLPYGLGTHCGGVVITARPIRDVAPVQISAGGYPVLQWEKDGTEDMGLVKMDLLGNRSLAVIRDAIADIGKKGIHINEKNWRPDIDSAAIRLLAAGKSMGVFYVESPAMRQLQQKTGCGDFEHMVIHSSIIRPAANRFIGEYIRRLKGGSWKPEHPLMAGVLAETYGIMVYQEDVVKIAMAIAGFSFADADGLRKIMSRKDRQARLSDYREQFLHGACGRGAAPESALRIWDMCMSFSGYSFCKPHSASYVQVSFQSAWLKAHHPAEFMAAVMSNYGGYYITQAYISEAQRLGLRILPPDVNESNEKYAGAGKNIRVGLCQIRGLNASARAAIIAQREHGGKFADLRDFLARASVEKNDAEHLVYAGACDSLEPVSTRSQIFWRLYCFYRNPADAGIAPPLKAWSRLRTLRAQYRALGFLAPMHPITMVRCKARPDAVKLKDIGCRIGRRITFLGWCISSKTVADVHGESMQFVSFEDETALCETVIFHDAYKKFIRYLSWQNAFWVSGKVSREYDAITVIVDAIEKPLPA
jgi:DNA polymerase-3 subunit alpha/error-prone DNA polymerase